MKIDTTSGDYDFTYLSLGAGVQSSALLVLALTTDTVPTPDAVIFADTGDEPEWVYSYVETLREWAAGYGCDIHTARNPRGTLSHVYTVSQRRNEWYARLPVFTSNGVDVGMTGRHCTREFKIQPIEQKVRELLGYKPRQRIRERVRALQGISRDEVQRMKSSRTRWITLAYPLVDLGVRREDCYGIVADAGLPEPQRSACVFCPFHSDAYWAWLRDEAPGEFAKAVAFDQEIRHMPTRDYPAYLHRSCVPLAEAVFNTTDPNQIDMWAECEGMCGV